MEVVEGRRLVELRPRIDMDKGTALLDLISEYAPTSAIYAGDDVLDLQGPASWSHLSAASLVRSPESGRPSVPGND